MQCKKYQNEPRKNIKYEINNKCAEKSALFYNQKRNMKMGYKNLSTAEIKYIIRTLFMAGNVQASVFDASGFMPRGVARAKKYTFSSKDFSINYVKWVVDEPENITDVNVRGLSSDGKIAGNVQIHFPKRPTLYLVGQDAEDIANFSEKFAPNIFSMSSIYSDYQR